MSPMNNSTKYWRSLDELAETPEFKEALGREFPDQSWHELPPATRRSFLKVMGASMAFAGLTACRWPKEEIVPFAHRPEGRKPGVPRFFATSTELAGVGQGMVVTSFDGRPIKAEGNPEHPESLGALSAISQARILELYDPDRSAKVLRRFDGAEEQSDWQAFASDLEKAMSAPGAAILSEAVASQSFRAMREGLLTEKPAIRSFEWEPISRDNERQGLRLATGRVARLQPHFDRAKVIACFDADPLFDHPAALRLAREFAETRQPSREWMSRLYVAESFYTLTGGQADHRLPTPASGIPRLLAALAARLRQEYGVAIDAALHPLLDGTLGLSDAEEVYLGHLAKDLAASGGHGLVMVGPRQSAESHALVAAINHALGAQGVALSYTDDIDPERSTYLDSISELVAAIRAGEIRSLLILGGNPAYDAPADLGFGELLDSLDFSAHLSLYDNETSRRCQWSLPRSHALESWGDSLSWDGTQCLQQPLIDALYGGKTPAEIVAMARGRRQSAHEITRKTVLAGAANGDAEAFWRKALHDGFLNGALATVEAVMDGAGLKEAAAQLSSQVESAVLTAQSPELVLHTDSKVFDGRFANNGWLQELPEAITKITWDNALLISPVTARELGVEHGDVLRVEASGASIEAPVYLLPGAAHASLALALGYGRGAAGSVGNGVGVNAYTLRTSERLHVLSSVNVSATGRTATLAITQNHHAIDATGFKARNERSEHLIREATIGEFTAHPEVIKHKVHEPELFSLWKEKAYKGEQWGMSIDLNACTGCNACVVACQAENNIPVVGKEQVINQREMQWIRLDRYFKTEAGVGPNEVDDAEMAVQPVACVHCENAPCEQVCPVAATQHTEDGLNAMVYNRCIGTRYCANNCPYKVRRFNFFNHHKDLETTTMMQYNPEVTVRSRGVMEKCTYCVQRIENARIVARNEDRPVADGEVIPACAQTCPSRAIVFGDLNDPESEISKMRQDPRSYATLAELNIKPRTHYRARLRNPAGVSEYGHGAHDDHEGDHHGGDDHDDHGHGQGA